MPTIVMAQLYFPKLLSAGKNENFNITKPLAMTLDALRIDLSSGAEREHHQPPAIS